MARPKSKKGVVTVEEQIAGLNVRISHLQLMVEKLQGEVCELVCKDNKRCTMFTQRPESSEC